MLAGAVPFDAPYRAAILMAHTASEPPLLSDLVPTVPRPVALAVRQALAKDPRQRYPDCRTFAETVLEALADAGAGRVRIPVAGWWFARPECESEVSWSEVGETPAVVTLSPGEVYWLLARDGVTDDQLASLARLGTLPGLRSLGLSFLHQLSDVGLVHLRGFTSLETLSLSQCAQLSDAGFAHLGCLDRLRSLSLDETQISDEGLAILQGFPLLEELNLGQCKRITDRGLANLRCVTGLRKLLLINCPGVTDVGVDQLRELTELRILDLSQTAVTDRGLAALHGLTRLEALYLAGLEGVTESGLSQLTSLVELRKLFLGNCRGVRSVAPLLRMQQLEVLGLDGTPITDEDLNQLARHTRLQTLDVRRCQAVTTAGVEAFRAALPGCRVSGP
jgi:hypothetical protein